VSWKNKEFKDLKDTLVSFSLYFVLVEMAYVFLSCPIYFCKCFFRYTSVNVDLEGDHLFNTQTHTDSNDAWMFGLGLALLQPLPFIGQHSMGLGLLGQNGSTHPSRWVVDIY
jgi:hypothetical protein